MRILAIETSCDETGISIVEAQGDYASADFSVLANTLHSQVAEHAQYGGVYPTVAKREHSRNLVPLLEKALSKILSYKTPSPVTPLLLKESRSTEILQKIKDILEREPELFVQLALFFARSGKPDIDAIAVTYGPGLAPALWVGVNFARALAVAWGVPLVPVNHMEGHIFSASLKRSEEPTLYSLLPTTFPALALLISGGHTELVLMRDWQKYEYLGGTRDDAVGEAFDKVARLLGLQYPGGPEISRLAKKSREQNLEQPFTLPRPMQHTDDFDFSFSGLKTAVLTLTKKLGDLNDTQKMQIAREFEDAVADVLAYKVIRSLEETGAQSLIIGGGVAANSYINKRLEEILKNKNLNVSLNTPPSGLTGDNALMIAVAGYFRTLDKQYIEPRELAADANLKLAKV